MRNLILIFAVLFGIMAGYYPSAHANNCNTATISSLLPSLPPLNGARDLQNTLALADDLRNIKGASELQAKAREITSLLDRIDPDNLLNQLKNIDRYLPKNDLKTAGIMGAATAELLGNSGVSAMDSQLRQLYSVLNMEYRMTADKARQTELYQQMNRINQIIGKWTDVNAGVNIANQKVNQVLEKTGLGQTADKLDEILSLAANPSQILRDPTKVLDLVKGMNAEKLSGVQSQLDEICGLLPPGALQEQIARLGKSLANGDIDAALKQVADYAKDALSKKVSDVLKTLPDSAVKDALKDVKKDLENGDIAGAVNGIANKGVQEGLAALGKKQAADELGAMGEGLGGINDLGANAGKLGGIISSAARNQATRKAIGAEGCSDVDQTQAAFARLFNKQFSTNKEDHYRLRENNVDPCQ